MTATRTQLISTLEQTPPTLKRITSALTDAALDFRPAPDEWSTREILAHLVDDEMFVMRTRLERMVEEDIPSLTSHDEKKWYHTRNTSRDALVELLNGFAIQRAASLNILTLLRDNEWERTAYHPEYGTFTIAEWLEHWAEHDVIHIHQIEQNSTRYQERS